LNRYFKNSKKMSSYLKVKVLNNQIESNIITELLEESDIPFFIRGYHDTAYNGIFTGQFGFGDLYVREDFLTRAVSLIRQVENELDEI
jgi:hypothetical protein